MLSKRRKSPSRTSKKPVKGATDYWQSQRWLTQNGYGNLVKAIRSDPRFPTFKDFLTFMEAPILSHDLVGIVRSCKSKEDFLNLFEALGVTGAATEVKKKATRKRK